MPKKGYKQTKEHKENERKSRLERKKRIGFLNSPKTRQKMREAKIGEKNPCFGRCGKDNPSWVDGRSPKIHRIRNSIEARLWREAVFARDSFTCQKCRDNKGGNLNAHHIQNFADYPELRFAIDNGITFCKRCHEKFHKKYGQRNNTKEQIEEFLS